jgi:pimeloyl-ACP methyl ester carboxylesterase
MVPLTPGTNSAFGSIKQIEAGVLNVSYAEDGPATGPVVLLLHGWPYEIHSYVSVAPRLASAGYRVIVPYVRGYGATRFLFGEAPRNGQQSVLAVDAIALMDTLGIERAILADFDWGARTADIIAAIWPERCKALVSVSGYLIGSQKAGMAPLPPQAELQWWYQFYFATERGRTSYHQYRRDFNRLIWQLAWRQWAFDAVTFERTAASFDNPDHVSIVIHNYRWRLGLAEGESRYDELEQRLAASPVITVPTITLEGDANGAPHSAPSAYARTARRPRQLACSVALRPRRRRWSSRSLPVPLLPLESGDHAIGGPTAAQAGHTAQAYWALAAVWTLTEREIFAHIDGAAEHEALLAEAMVHAEAANSEALRAAVWDARGNALHATFVSGRTAGIPVEHPDELACFARGLAMRRTLGNPRELAESLFHVGLVHQVVRGEPAASLPYFQEAYDRAIQSDDTILQSYAIRHLGLAKSAVGDAAAARPALLESLRLREEAGFVPCIALALIPLAQDALAEGDRDTARGHYTRARNLLASLHATHPVAWIDRLIEELG